MPYKYIGRKTDFKGKTLWEIVGNLKNFGVGRVVVRSMMERYPEPSYFRILKVEPLQCPQVQSVDNLRKVRVLVEKTFRGMTFPKPVTIERASYKTDYRLLSKDEEEEYCKKVLPKEVQVYPNTMDFPPLLQEYIIREKKTKGEDTDVELKLDIVYNKNHNSNSVRIAKDGEIPTVTFDINMRKLPSISLYKNVKM
ncbi:hypothetical protein Zmor_006214 [Zophobas morio]|uniref:28S ribosomal protein S34, mitochondrial n=1 Tax=Zophobas morio TaxID=2755281 RepID=A0AA38IRH0_9CUCU|nr:hypothetical protein Zmor_006214 [Zophobas morio]